MPAGCVRILFLVATASGLCACKSVSLDMRELQYPVILNPNPFVGRRIGEQPGRRVDTYAGLVTARELTASVSSPGYYTPGGGYAYANTTTSSSTAGNDAQVAAFAKLAGHPDRAITGVTIDVATLNINALVALGQRVDISVSGSVTEYPGLQAAGDAP